MRGDRVELFPGVFLTSLPGTQFKTNVLTAYLVRPLCRDKAAMGALLPQVLCRGNRRYTDMRSLSEALDDLYGASLIGGVRKLGEWQTFGLSCDFIGDSFSDGNQTAGIVELMSDTLLCPALSNGIFNAGYVTGERDKLIDAIQAKKNDKASYALSRLEALACKDEPYGVDRLGDQETMAAVTPEALWDFYRDVLATSQIELFYCGQTGKDEVAGLLRTALGARLEGVKRRDFARPVIPFVARAAGEPEYFAETAADVTQAKLALLWRTGVEAGSRDFTAACLAASIYGGGTTSKLFLNVRERLSLCYYASCSIDRYKGVMRAQSGVEPCNVETARGEMLSQWADVAAGRFSERDMDNAKAALIAAWRSQCDTPGGLERFWHGQAVAGLGESAEEWEDMLRGVTAADTARVAGGFTLDAAYVLSGEQQ